MKTNEIHGYEVGTGSAHVYTSHEVALSDMAQALVNAHATSCAGGNVTVSIDAVLVNADTVAARLSENVKHCGNYVHMAQCYRNRIESVLRVMHRVYPEFDESYLMVDGGDYVTVKYDGEESPIDSLPAGVLAILNIVTEIIESMPLTGYAYKSEEESVTVCIYRLGSGLLSKDQPLIVRKLAQAFPNTDFYITTDSVLIISRLITGELKVVRKTPRGLEYEEVESPYAMSTGDLIKAAFGVDMNQVKVKNASAAGQLAAKKALLRLIER